MLRWLLAWLAVFSLALPHPDLHPSKLSLDQIVANFFSFYSDAQNQRRICMTSARRDRKRTHIYHWGREYNCERGFVALTVKLKDPFSA